MTSEEFEKVIEAWLTAAAIGVGKPGWDEQSWASDQVNDWCLKQPDVAWRFILEAYKRPMSDKAENIFAAGPIEDLLSFHGPKFIDRVEELAKTDDRFNFFLGGVWQGRMTPEVWKRVQDVRKEVWDD